MVNSMNFVKIGLILQSMDNFIIEAYFIRLNPVEKNWLFID